MNILYVGNLQGFDNAGKFYMVSQKLANGFTRNGHNVYVFNDRDYARASNIFRSSKIGRQKLNRKLVDVCREFTPDLIVLGHCELIENDTLREIRDMNDGVRIIYRNVDPLHAPRNIEKIRNRAEVVDGVFVTTAGDALKELSGGRAFVCFMPNPVDSSIETGRAFAARNDIDVFFAGGFVRDFADERRQMLERLSRRLEGIEVYFHLAPGQEDKLWGRNYIRVQERSKIGLCLNKTDDYYLYSSDRMAQYMGNGLFVMIHAKSGFQDLFSEGEIGFFNDEAEVEDMIFYYVAHDDIRRNAAQRGWERAHDIFDSSKVARFMIEKTYDLPLSQDYVWPVNHY